MHLSEGDVARAVHELQQWQLVTQAPPDRNARSNRFMHAVETRLGWNPQERALMAELLLRGPQTLGELKGNAARMTPVGDLQFVTELLNDLSRRETPFVTELARQPGKSTTRFDHCLYPDDEPREQPAAASPPEFATPAPSGGMLEERVAQLESEVASLREELAALRSQMGA
jgi:uncharacterized protein YceH (UPF0502 family)